MGRHKTPICGEDGLRECSQCRERLELVEFYFRNGRPAGTCKSCVNVKDGNKRLRARNREFNRLVFNMGRPRHD